MKKIAVFFIIICFSCCQIKHSKPLHNISDSNALDTTRVRFDGFYNVLDNSIIQIKDCEDLIKEKQTEKSKTIDDIVFGSKKDRISDSIISANKVKYCEDNGKKYSDVFTSTCLVVFNKKRESYIDYGSNRDDKPYKCSYYKTISEWHKDHKKEFFGSYTIKKDSIYAYVPITLLTWGLIQRTVNCNYRGYIKNRDTITDWKIIPPYPNGTNEFIRENNKQLFNPQTLYFVKTDAVKCLQMD